LKRQGSRKQSALLIALPKTRAYCGVFSCKGNFVPNHFVRIALLLVFVLVLGVVKELVMVAMSITRVDFYLPISLLPYAPYLILAILVFPIIGWLFAKLIRVKTVALGSVCGLLFLTAPLVYLQVPIAGDDLFLLLANLTLALSFILWVVVFNRLRGSSTSV
jgi:hypothetical protein